MTDSHVLLQRLVERGHDECLCGASSNSDEATRVEDNDRSGFNREDTEHYITTYFRHNFVVTNVASYLNGCEAARFNMNRGDVNYLTLARNAGDDGKRFIPATVPASLIDDKAYDSDKLDREMMTAFATEVIAPHRQGRRPERRTQDGRSLRCFHRRWKAERMFAWLYNFRRLVVRWE